MRRIQGKGYRNKIEPRRWEAERHLDHCLFMSPVRYGSGPTSSPFYWRCLLTDSFLALTCCEDARFIFPSFCPLSLSSPTVSVFVSVSISVSVSLWTLSLGLCHFRRASISPYLHTYIPACIRKWKIVANLSPPFPLHFLLLHSRYPASP